MKSILFLVAVFLVGGCGSPSDSATPMSDAMAESPVGLQAGGAQDVGASGGQFDDKELRVLFVGNSHTAPIPAMLKQIFKQSSPTTKTTFKKFTGGGFLDQHSKSRPLLNSIRTGKWDYVVLQAQKYSSSGKYTYPTDGAIKLANLARESGAVVIMYPEWSRRGNTEEYPRIRKIHDSIARETEAVVAPIGEAWELAIKNNPNIDLYARDGNHASRMGSWLVASVFYSMIQKQSPATGAGGGSAGRARRSLEKSAWAAVSIQESSQESDRKTGKRSLEKSANKKGDRARTVLQMSFSRRDSCVGNAWPLAKVRYRTLPQE